MPRDVVSPDVPLPQPYVSPDLFERYVEEANSYAVDALKDARSNASTWKRAFAGVTVAVTALGIGVGVLAMRHTEHWGLLISDPTTGTTRMVKDVRDAAMTLPVAVDDWFLERYVQMREGWNEADADAAFQAVACMSDLDEQRRFAGWYNDAKSAPQQVFARARRGWRAVTTTAAPGTEGMTVSGARRVAVPFTWEDKGIGDVTRATSGTARFTVRKDRKAVQPCNPAGLVISEYSRTLDREPQP